MVEKKDWLVGGTLKLKRLCKCSVCKRSLSSSSTVRVELDPAPLSVLEDVVTLQLRGRMADPPIGWAVTGGLYLCDSCMRDGAER